MIFSRIIEWNKAERHVQEWRPQDFSFPVISPFYISLNKEERHVQEWRSQAFSFPVISPFLIYLFFQSITQELFEKIIE